MINQQDRTKLETANASIKTALNDLQNLAVTDDPLLGELAVNWLETLSQLHQKNTPGHLPGNCSRHNS